MKLLRPEMKGDYSLIIDFSVGQQQKQRNIHILQMSEIPIIIPINSYYTQMMGILLRLKLSVNLFVCPQI